MGKVAFYTLGCKVNQYETEAMTELFEKNGYDLVESEEVADVYVINTCTVTNLGDRKSRQFIRRCKRKNPDSIVAVVGCYSQTAPDEVSKIEEVDVILGTSDRNKIVEYVKKKEKQKEKINVVTDIMEIKDFEEMTIHNIKGKTRAFLKIQEGCNQYCSYCIIPYARGPIRSRKLEDIIKEVKRLVENGFDEVVLTGIHVASYGKDLEEGTLLDVIKEVNKIEGLKRIRLSSIEPTIMTKEFVKTLSELDKVCEHFHLSLQSGCDETLKRMNRKYTTKEYREVVDRIRGYMPKVSITTDIIVGFPGETDEEFEKTIKFVKDIKFSQIHVFKYSPRKGTPAAKFENQVDGIIKNKRSEELISIVEKLTKEYNNKFIGQNKHVLFETKSAEEEGYYEGLTENYIKVLCKSNEDISGKVLNTKLEKIHNEIVFGSILNK
ncbi:MAG: tRNA (N(6)-L-threonylcarbamoyladenosine(37)-C(2))-methylthiotransferase MtaB [Anaeromicrobium sp.]|jgi:threonylcarbamoyladenosine tRNA methylthiotransferase MtaB|uniref:tRNA (N(6)-L-threonylcarbamoyladenosine(37)-C(2))- methylthiotransferase MtaB n=1 Tax=Anaeromicrobium sp. TaxID=1929132 RepID=UPI0025D1664D|nr:tRNA (N(6)-L-threonylcarbamoyladenosine(37)-C(2))-methylthiotransferase MtaB [Anaeromicrobium sp.]MCT4594601.1 tRNA (N(6)-L-threonylcarbamoyladenosine(37)-C(2))-methylthiotransferase MtaB [Anaeromicrobium sp.]